MAHPQVAAFARLAEENSTPTRLLAGQKTLMARTMHDIRYDEVNDELLVTLYLRKVLVSKIVNEHRGRSHLDGAD